MSTPHIAAAPGEIAATVLMPGDPMRADRIAERHLDDARMVSRVRGIVAHTGTYQGKPLTVMASGMGMPSITIYATELFAHYGVSTIVRVGTCGGLRQDVQLRDVVVATAAHTDSAMTVSRMQGIHYSHCADHDLAAAAVRHGRGLPGPRAVRHGAVLTSDHFYLERGDTMARLAAFGTWAVEMEAAGLYAAADAHGARALSVLTVTDHLLYEEQLTAQEREQSFDDAVSIALAAVTDPIDHPRGNP